MKASDDPDVFRLRAFLTLGNTEFHPLPFFKLFEAVGDDRTEVNEYVGAIVLLNESVALLGVKPLYSARSCRHNQTYET